jgi:hypothetical protein
VGSLLEITRVDSGLRNIKTEDVARRHRWPIHVLHTREEVHSTIDQLGPLLDVLPQTLCISWRVIVTFDRVHIFTEIANPFLAHFDELYERIYVGTTVFTPNDRFIIEVRARDRFARWQLTKGLHDNGQRNRCFFGLLRGGRYAICRHSHERLV